MSRGLFSRYVPRRLRAYVAPLVFAARREVERLIHLPRIACRPKPAAYRGRRVAILGFAAAPTGLGRGARLAFEELRQHGVHCALFDVEPMLGIDPLASQTEIDRLVSFAPEDIVLHVNPPLFGDVVRRLPQRVMSDTFLIAYWAWELRALPAFWRKDACLADAVHTPSIFVADAVRASLPRFPGPIRVSPHPTHLSPSPVATVVERSSLRNAFGFPESAFIAGFAFAMASNYARKNPLGAIQAFQLAFPTEADAYLVLRCPDLDGYPAGAAELRTRAGLDRRIRLLDSTEIAIADFYHLLDVYLSLTRSEGFGLTLAEAADAGVPVITTGYSIGDDILSRPNVFAVDSHRTPVSDPQGVYSSITNAFWAAPDIVQAANYLRESSSRRFVRSQPASLL